MMTAGAAGLGQMRLGGLGMAQRVLGVQRPCASSSHAEAGKNQYWNPSKCPNARQLHPVNILSTKEFVPRARP
jgi:hypothetical protein